jgi:DNA-binding NtrC family response regulator
VLDGLELTEKVHSLLPELPVILMSGTFEAGQEPLPSGAANFLVKPFRLEQLLAIIDFTLHPPQRGNI